VTADFNARATRVVLNFSHRCALNCEWCYVPFETSRAQRHVVTAIIDRIASLRFETITFGGGDPFQYPYIGELAERAKAAGLIVHIDTHGKSLTQSLANAQLVSKTIDLIGLPLDGPNSNVHDDMRSAPGHFDIVMRRLRWLNSIGAQFKINTVVSRRNVDSLAELATHVRDLAPWRWSIYQYMPLGPGARVSTAHWLELAEFQSAISRVREKLGSQHESLIEVSDKDSRRLTYPIVHHDGSVFVHSKERVDSLQHVCSVFDPQARQAIDEICGPERAAAVTRYMTIR
jgi:MoaA/NifB/PqqE/SkfB family radical SAM enzyme